MIRASGIPAHGSYLGCLTANLTLGQGCRIRGFGRNSSASFAIRSHTTYGFVRWTRRLVTRRLADLSDQQRIHSDGANSGEPPKLAVESGLQWDAKRPCPEDR
jgi:hypothetical protein